jgi:ribonuclease-3 family protein
MQAKAMHVLETGLSEQEAAIVHRGRNAKSMVPKSASVSEYRAATAFETLCGWLLLTDQEKRLEEFMEQAFQVISREMQEPSDR